MKFWENHAIEMRKARLLAAYAIIRASGKAFDAPGAVELAFELETEINKRLPKESK